jgi:hypothetical protein
MCQRAQCSSSSGAPWGDEAAVPVSVISMWSAACMLRSALCGSPPVTSNKHTTFCSPCCLPSYTPQPATPTGIVFPQHLVFLLSIWS